MVPSEKVIAQMASQTDTILMSFSCGKDSIAAWLAVRGHFKRIIPYYCYLVPDLEFVERSLRYYEDFFETEILRLPHPSLYRWLDNFIFQAPQNCTVIERADLGIFEYADIARAIREDFGLDDAAYIASGVRAVDSPIRWAHFKKRGAISSKQQQFYPVYDWRKERLLQVLADSRVKLPVDYRLFGRSFDGLDLRFLIRVRDVLPDDYARILSWFPMVDLEIARYEYAQKEIN